MIENPNEIEFSGLDLRILTLTIGLCLSFLCRAILDTLYVFDIMNISLNSPFMDLLPITITELLPSFLVARIMRKRGIGKIERITTVEVDANQVHAL